MSVGKKLHDSPNFVVVKLMSESVLNAKCMCAKLVWALFVNYLNPLLLEHYLGSFYKLTHYSMLLKTV